MRGPHRCLFSQSLGYGIDKEQISAASAKKRKFFKDATTKANLQFQLFNTKRPISYLQND